ncbi:hypothetical protein BU23DRAFT_120567 [Bimuria novae-zelandiae CBS 107.79]|uniref:RBR-type E3 ubiquitin transferase n=1 Tax=Bimuria novae-zelandiae CBS 107.79 TaxID=1447943 RepID=A0A6A5VAX4_9PLEO|nr:hypothetical protein BU23DRAFT_120567 [Bimuria novae-zelandiae CBS 107.79]
MGWTYSPSSDSLARSTQPRACTHLTLYTQVPQRVGLHSLRHRFAIQQIKSQSSRASVPRSPRNRSSKRRWRRKRSRTLVDQLTRNAHPAAREAFAVFAGCEHEPRTYPDCLEMWVDSQVNNSIIESGIRCPSTCDCTLTCADLKGKISPSLFERLEDSVTRAGLRKMPGYRDCMSDSCKSGQFHDSATRGNLLGCNDCGFLVCTFHNVPFHEGETCEMYDQRTKAVSQEEDASQKKIQRISRPCPNCGINIEKMHGCDQMTCKKCSHSFCYRCGIPYHGTDGILINGNNAHEESCVHFRAFVNEVLPTPIRNALRSRQEFIHREAALLENEVHRQVVRLERETYSNRRAEAQRRVDEWRAQRRAARASEAETTEPQHTFGRTLREMDSNIPHPQAPPPRAVNETLNMLGRRRRHHAFATKPQGPATQLQVPLSKLREVLQDLR